jgi:predicted nucleic acid-binding protein
MIGLDTTVLISHELEEHPAHSRVRSYIQASAWNGEKFALSPQVLHEFLHVVTDGKRFQTPLTISDALARSRFWENASEIVMVYPDRTSSEVFNDWMSRYQLGRKRILDISLAACYYTNGIRKIATANPSDFTCFEVFTFAEWVV